MDVKKDFPIFENNPDLIYLDSAATTQKPKQVINAVKEFYEKYNANIHRGLYDLSEKATEKYEEAREVVAKFINASPEEIIFTSGTTDSLNSLARVIDSLTGKEKNEIVLTEMEHHSNLIPWQQLAKKKGWKLKFIKITYDLELDLEDAKNKITDKTAVLSFTHVSNSLGTINPAEEIVKIAKEKGALTIIDGAQSVPHMKTDVKKIDCDFLAFSGHKMLGPFGIGVLYGKKELLEKMEPFNFGGGMISSVSYENADWNKVPEKFEAGTTNVVGVIGLAEAVKYLEKIGMENIEEYIKNLTDYAFGKLQREGLNLYSPTKNSGIISMNLNNIHGHDIASILNQIGRISIRAGNHCNMPLMKKLKIPGTCRISFYLYNTFEDIDKFTKGIRESKSSFKHTDVGLQKKKE